MSVFAKDKAECGDANAPSRKLRAKMLQFLSEEVRRQKRRAMRRQKRRAMRLLFETLEYLSFLSRHVTKLEV